MGNTVLCIMLKHHRNEELIRYIASRLRVLRLQCGLSQEKVLFETGIYVERIEAGLRNVTVSTLLALCVLYGVSLHEFFNPQPDEHEQEESHPQ